MQKYFSLIAILILILVVAVFLGAKTSKTPLSPNASQTSQEQTKTEESMEVVAQNLEVPWAVAFLPNHNILLTERAGRIKLVHLDGSVSLVGRINVKQTGESGLHGIAVHPQYPQQPYVYLYYTYSSGGNNSMNRVSRFVFNGTSLVDEQVIVDKIPGAVIHDGGRIKFGPDGVLYITTGDASNPSLAQDKNSLAGKILQVDVNENKIEVYSYGHRNPQGIAWDSTGRLWSTEHGQSAQDEINLIEKDKNYGWPIIRGDQTKDGMTRSMLQSGNDTWAPAGTAIVNNSLFFAGLRGQALYEVNLKTLALKEHFKGELGRIREVVVGPDGMLYITTSNRDGRAQGAPKPGDDKIIRVNPSTLAK